MAKKKPTPKGVKTEVAIPEERYVLIAFKGGATLGPILSEFMEAAGLVNVFKVYLENPTQNRHIVLTNLDSYYPHSRAQISVDLREVVSIALSIEKP